MNNSDVTGFDITPPSPPQGGKFRNQEEVTPPSPPQGGKFRNQEEVTPPSPPKGGNSGIRKKSPPQPPPKGGNSGIRKKGNAIKSMVSAIKNFVTPDKVSITQSMKSAGVFNYKLLQVHIVPSRLADVCTLG
ncbi:hypothetical protein [Microcoleus sp. CAWBG640]|uniref:hypothetical protein n=1 Tax=Microcoleus sp. CAWBG640 TaxID=2841653 RepID=UPI00312B2FB0